MGAITCRAERRLLGLPPHPWLGTVGCSSPERRGHRSSAPSAQAPPLQPQPTHAAAAYLPPREGSTQRGPEGLLLPVPRCWRGSEPKPLATEWKQERQRLCWG